LRHGNGSQFAKKSPIKSVSKMIFERTLRPINRLYENPQPSEFVIEIIKLSDCPLSP
jgi:hypothetical protein